MKSYWTVLSVGFLDRKQAKRFRLVMYKPQSEGGNGLNRQKLYLVQDGYGKWRVVRHLYEWELDDPLEGNEEWLRLYRRPYLRAQTKRVKPWIAKKRRKK